MACTSGFIYTGIPPLLQESVCLNGVPHLHSGVKGREKSSVKSNEKLRVPASGIFFLEPLRWYGDMSLALV